MLRAALRGLRACAEDIVAAWDDAEDVWDDDPFLESPPTFERYSSALR